MGVKLSAETGARSMGSAGERSKNCLLYTSTQFPQGLAGLGTGIVKLAGLPDDNRAGTDNKYFMDILSFWHAQNPL